MGHLLGVHPARRSTIPLLVAGMLLAGAALLDASDNSRQSVLAPLADMAARSLGRLNASDVAGAREVFKAFEGFWSPVEDSVKAADPSAYARIEVDATRAEAALEASPPDTARARRGACRAGKHGCGIWKRTGQSCRGAHRQRRRPGDAPRAGA